MRRVFELLNELVREEVIPNYSIAGAIGAVFYVEPFATQDIDVLIVMENEPVRVVLAEHLVAIMLKTGRLKDLARAQMFVTQQAVDMEILLDIIDRHELEQRWEDFQEHLHE